MSKITKTVKSRFRGVNKCGPNKWEATIHLSEKNILYLGEFSSEEKAALVYDEAAKKHQGSYAIVNFEDEETEGSTTSPSYHSGSGSEEGDSTNNNPHVSATRSNRGDSSQYNKLTTTKSVFNSNNNDINSHNNDDTEVSDGASQNNKKIGSAFPVNPDSSSYLKSKCAAVSSYLSLNVREKNSPFHFSGTSTSSSSSIINNNYNSKINKPTTITSKVIGTRSHNSDNRAEEMVKYKLKNIADWISKMSSKPQTKKEYYQLNAVVNSGNLNDLEKTKNALTQQTKLIREIIEKLERSNKATISKHLSPDTIKYLTNSCYEEITVTQESIIENGNSSKKRKRKDSNSTDAGSSSGNEVTIEKGNEDRGISEAVVIVLCPHKEHRCVFEAIAPSTDYPHGEWICDVCDKSFVKGKRWACNKCGYDCCPSCGRKQNICISSNEKRARIPRTILTPGNSNNNSNSKKKKKGSKSTFDVRVKERPFDPSKIFKISMEELVVGQTVEIEWVENGKPEWYSGRVASYNKIEDKHKIEYFNNEIEFVALLADRSNGINWRIPPPPPSPIPRRKSSKAIRRGYEHMMLNEGKLRVRGLTQSQKQFLIKIKKRRQLEKIKHALPSPDSVMANQRRANAKRRRGRPKGALNKTTLAKYYELLELQRNK
jgi:hypothetical protein